MSKIVVFDSGYGGELFADFLEERLGCAADVIRVIDWRHAETHLTDPRAARRLAEAALRPYLGSVDLVFFANHLLSLTSLKYFRQRYKNQLFLGLDFLDPSKFIRQNLLILTTRQLAKTLNFRNYLFRLRANKKVIQLDHWPALIDDGELTEEMIITELAPFVETFNPDAVILTCSQFSDIAEELLKAAKYRAKIYDSFDDSYREVCRALRLRGAAAKRKK